MKHKSYPKYKPSGIDWIGDIPEGWDKKRIKYISKVNSDALSEDTDEIFEFYYIDIGNVTLENGFSRGEKITFSEAPSRARRIVKEGDTIISTVRTYLKAIAYIDDSESELIASTGFAVVRPERKIDRKYLYYSLCSERVVHTISAISVGVSYPAINASDLACIFLIFPNKSEQKKIADFLDQKTAQIDDLIQKKEEMIKLLKEKRAAIINQAVIKGIDPNAKMKPSGIDWIGDIPEGWDVRRLKFIASTKFSNVDKHSKEEEQPVSLCNYVDVYYNDFIDSNMDFMQATATNDEIRKFALNKGDVIVTKDSESWDDIAIPAYIKEDMHGVLCGYHLAIIQANQNMCGEYIFWSFLSQTINYQFQVSATGVTRYGLGKGSLDNAMFFAPSKKEQHQIAKYLDKKTTEIDGLIQKIESAIAKLREYRSSLITATVTGKIDVREVVNDK